MISMHRVYICKYNSNPQGEKICRFAKEQDNARKDCGAGIWCPPILLGYCSSMKGRNNVSCDDYLYVCVHNIIVKDGRDANIYNQGWNFQDVLIELVSRVPPYAS
jgi:hypothetical protein